MAEKTLKTRIIQKHDTEANWLLATNFTPMNGEIIIYDEDDNHNYKRIKVGNGIDNVNVLDFYAGDWNDLKNKPKYKEETLRTIFQETDIEINEDLFTEIGDINLKENETYFITLNDITYTCKAWKDKDTNWLCVGNGIFNEQENGDNVPFLLDYHGYFVVAESGIYKLKIETFKNYIVTSEQEITVPERIQTLSNFNLLNFIPLKNLIRINGSDFDENGYYYFNNNEIPEYIGLYEYKLSTSNPWSEEIGVPIEVEGNHHPSKAPIIFKDFSLDQNCIRALRKDVVIPEELNIIPGKIQWKYSISPSLYVGITLEELEDGTKIAYFWKTFDEILEAEKLGQTIQFSDDEKYYSIMETTTSNLKLQSIKDNKIVTIDWNSNEEYGYVTEKNLSSSWNDLEDRPFYSEVQPVELFNKTVGFADMMGDGSIYSGNTGGFTLEEEFEEVVIVWDDIEYVCQYKTNDMLGECFGNEAILNAMAPSGQLNYPDTGEPFLFYARGLFVTTSKDTQHNIAVFANKMVDVPIPSKYLGVNIRNGEGEYSIVSGYIENNVASGSGSHAEGAYTTASGYDSHAEGSQTIASGDYSHAQGNNTVANRRGMNTIGEYNDYEDIPPYTENVYESTMGGGYNSFYSADSYSFNKNTGKYTLIDYETVTAVEIGKYVLSNRGQNGVYHQISEVLEVNSNGYPTKVMTHIAKSTANSRGEYVHVVGNGDYNKRSNAHTLDWDGNAWFAGDVYIGGTSQDDGSKLITEAKVDEKISEINIPEQDLSNYALKSEIPSIAGLATEAYADNAAAQVKNDLLNGAGAAYDTLKELGDLIDTNVNAIDALETVASGKADKGHGHAISDVTDLQITLDELDNKISNMQIIYKATDYGISTNLENNTPALQTLINTVNANGGGIIYFPIGTYNFKSAAEKYAILAKSNVSIIGENLRQTIFKQTEERPYSMFFFQGTADTPIVGCTYSNFTVDAYSTGWNNQVYGKAFYYQYVRDCVFRDLLLKGTVATALGIDYLDRVLIENVNVVDGGRTYDGDDTGTSGIGIGTGGWETENFFIHNCICKGCGQYGIFIENQYNLGWGGNTDFSKGCIISNCIVHSGLNKGIGIRGGQNVTVTGCEVYENALDGIYLDGKCKNVKIKDCNVSNNRSNGILVENTMYSSKIVIANNIIDSNSGIGLMVVPHAQLLSVMLQDNTIIDNIETGIDIHGSIDSLSIIGNYVKNCGNKTGLLLEQNANYNDCVIMNNMIFDAISDNNAYYLGNCAFNHLCEHNMKINLESSDFLQNTKLMPNGTTAIENEAITSDFIDISLITDDYFTLGVFNIEEMTFRVAQYDSSYNSLSESFSQINTWNDSSLTFPMEIKKLDNAKYIKICVFASNSLPLDYIISVWG